MHLAAIVSSCLCTLYACMLDITTFILDFILKSFYWLVRALFEILLACLLYMSLPTPARNHYQ